MLLIAHLSDLHVIDWGDARWHQFIGKRMTGAANFWLRRRDVHRREVLCRILEDLAAQAPDHVAITGDLTSLAFRRELSVLRGLLRELGLTGERVSIVPGNHDAYTKTACIKHLMLAELGEYATSDLHGAMPGFPFVRLRGEVAFIGLDSSVSRPWFVANGLLGRKQLEQLVELLQHAEVQRRLPVILLHHPPIPYAEFFKESHAGLLDRAGLIEALRRGLGGRDALILSGHWHRRSHQRLDLPGRVDVLVAPSASHFGGNIDSLAAYHLIDLAPAGSGDSRLRRVRTRGFNPDLGCVIDFDA